MTPLEAVLVPVALALPLLWVVPVKCDRRESIGPGRLYLEPGLVYVTA